MADFYLDTFTDSNGVRLTGGSPHVGETGASYTALTGFPGADGVISGNAVGTSTGNAIFTSSGVPPSANYTVRGRLKAAGTSHNGVIGRASTSAQICYSLTFNSNTLNVYKNASTFLQLCNMTWPGVSVDIYLTFAGTTISAQAQRLDNNQWLTSSNTWSATQQDCINFTDASIASAGRAGIWLNDGAILDEVEGFTVSSPLAAGTITITGTTPTSVSATATSATGGTAPYTQQWHRSTTPGFTPSGGTAIGGATGLTLNDTGLSNGTTYYYKVVYTDNVSATVTSSQAQASTTVPIALTDSHLFFSPYNWDSDGAGALQASGVHGSSTYAQSNTPGAYIKIAVTSTGSGSVVIDLDTTPLNGVTAGNCPTISCAVDGGGYTATQLAYATGTTRVTVASGLASGSHTIEINFRAVSLASSGAMGDRWTTPQAIVKVTGFEIDAGSTIASPTLRAKRMIVFGDSGTEGADSVGGSLDVASNDATFTYARALAATFGAEVGIVGFSAQGFAQAGYGNVPALTSAWDHFSSGRSRLISSLLSPVPDYIVCDHGTNGSTVQATVQSLISAWRTAGGANAQIWIVVPWNQDAQSPLSAAVSAQGDAKCFLVDPGVNFENGQNSNDNVHLNQRGSLFYAAAVAQKAQAAQSGTSGVAAPAIGCHFIRGAR